MLDPNKNRIALFVCTDLIGLQVVNQLVPAMLHRGLEPVICDTEFRRNREFKKPPPPDVSFYGAGLLRDTVIPLLEGQKPLLADTGTLVQGINYTYRQLADFYGLEYQRVRDVNDPDFVARMIDDQTLAGGLSVRFLQIFEEDIISALQEKGFMWNLHSGILPPYKGLLIPVWAVANGEQVYGWTLHYIDKDIDTGRLIATDSVPLNKEKSILETYTDMIPKGIGLVLKGLDHYLQYGPPLGTPQPAGKKRSYYPYPTSKQMENLHLHYADPGEALEYYTSRFSVPATAHHRAFRMSVAQAVGGWERSKIQMPETDQSAGNALHWA